MRQISTLLLMVNLLCCTAYGGQPQKPVDLRFITFTEPDSVEDLWAQSHLVLHVRVLGGRTMAFQNETVSRKRRNVFTIHRARVMDVYKSVVSKECASEALDVLGCSPQVGAEVSIWQSAGEVETADDIIRVADEEPLNVGSEYLIFLVWHPSVKAFVPVAGPNGTFEIRNGQIHRTTKGNFGREQEGKTPEGFLGALRKGSKP